MSSNSASLVDALLDRIEGLSPEVREKIDDEVRVRTSGMLWVPNPGPQTAALRCDADELFYGGSAGGGKSDLAIGLAITQHRRSLLMRRIRDDARDLAERLLAVLGTRIGYNGALLTYRRGNHFIRFGGCELEKDKQRFKGKPFDLMAFDEVGDFLESQYRFIIGWNRSSDIGQRVRTVCTGNPPTEPEGLWVIDYWGPWLDPKHPNPAEEGELRWYTTDGELDVEVDGPGPHEVNGELVYARSRTFIRARLDDNPDLTQTSSYAATLASLPQKLREAYRDGRFDAAAVDQADQAIPTEWVRAAQARWTERPPEGVPMSALGADVAQGGPDKNVIAIRFDGWFAPLVIIPGSETPLGDDIAGRMLALRRAQAVIIIDCGGGYGGSAYKTLKQNLEGEDFDRTVFAYKGATASVARTVDSKLRFQNKRAEVCWRFREALDPSQPWGSPIALPPDRELLADLCAPSFSVGPHGIKLEDPQTVAKRIGRSPDRGTAVLLCWSEGQRAVTHLYSPDPSLIGPEMGLSRRGRSSMPKFAAMSRGFSRRMGRR
jgi:hypothetical protein